MILNKFIMNVKANRYQVNISIKKNLCAVG